MHGLTNAEVDFGRRFIKSRQHGLAVIPAAAADSIGRLLDSERRFSMNLCIVDLIDLEDLCAALVECDAIGEHVCALIGGREGVVPRREHGCVVGGTNRD